MNLINANDLAIAFADGGYEKKCKLTKEEFNKLIFELEDQAYQTKVNNVYKYKGYSITAQIRVSVDTDNNINEEGTPMDCLWMTDLEDTKEDAKTTYTAVKEGIDMIEVQEDFQKLIKIIDKKVTITDKIINN